MTWNAPAPDPFTHKPLWIPACGSQLLRQQAAQTQAVYELVKGTPTDFLHVMNRIILNTNGEQHGDFYWIWTINPAAFFSFFFKGTVTEEVLKF